MFLPQLDAQKTSQQVTNVFRGYHNAKEIEEGEFLEIENFAGDDYPMLASRKLRGEPTAEELTTIDPATGLITKDELYFIRGGKLLKYSPSRRSVSLVTDAKTFEGEDERTFVSMGAYLLVFPDKWYINTMETEDCGDIEAKVEIAASVSAPVTFTICSRTGDEYGNVPTVKPVNPQSGDFWIDISGSPHLLKMWNAVDQTWVTVPTVYTKISHPGIGAKFKEMDGVKISGIVYGGSTPGVADQYRELNGTKVLYVCKQDYIVIVGMIDENTTQISGTVSVSRGMPDMDFVCESQNRLWGCKYGIIDGKPINELYCCKLGDFRNWNSFLGISTDSWAASIGSDGPWTGAITYNRYPTFFKENCMHRISISATGAHQVVETKLPGVQRDCSRSLAIVGSTLYYKGISGIYAYDGSPPVLVSQPLGDGQYYRASAGSLADKYYISMSDTPAESDDRNFRLYIYDTSRNIWYIEDGTTKYPSLFAECDGELYFTKRHMVGDTECLRLYGETGLYEAPESKAISWFARSGLIGYETVEQKYVSRFSVRMILPRGSRMNVYIMYDSDGKWHSCGHIVGTGTRTFMLPVRPRRCDHFRIGIAGTGSVKIYSFAKVFEKGSDVT